MLLHRESKSCAPSILQSISTQILKIQTPKQKKTSTSVLPLLINPKFIENVILLPLWDSIGIIDRDTQKFTKSITEARTFDSFTHNSPLQDIRFQTKMPQSHFTVWRNTYFTLSIVIFQHTDSHQMSVLSE
ncbi:hypothetical protein RIR_jg32969.t1 [Rhizophagus irregularis DAOM 181602=DAOM 197198]|nr:hypothetical protein RIR_jg32969.t1 [Rhizophagus irregularis DAOM 181602=DAOM 197198]